MKKNFTILAILLFAGLSAQAQNQITTPSGQPLTIGNNGVKLSNLNSGSSTSPSNGKVLSVDANGLLFLAPDESGAPSQWNTSGVNINYLSGNVGIGVATPLQRLHVNGDINIPTGGGLRINNVPFLRAPGTANTILGTNAGLNFNGGSFNIFLGQEAGAGNTPGTGGNTGSRNIFIGPQTGYSNTTGNNNINIGFAAGYSNQTGSLNVMIGPSAGQFASGNYNFYAGSGAGQYATGSYNYYLGFDSGKGSSNTPNTGQVNVFLGYRTGLVNTGSNNLFMGSQAGLNNTTGFRNVLIGSNSGVGNISGTLNTLIGFESDVLNPNLTNATAIGASAKVSQSNSVILGSLGTNVGINNSAPSARLHVTAGGSIATGVRFENLPNSAGTVYNLYVDANGNVMKSSSAGARESFASTDSHWELTTNKNLVNLNDGGVIIGTGVERSPEGYKLYVSEGILTEKVKVAVKGTSDWSDHVFEKNHKLISIKEVEEYIQTNKHLPGIPSASEMVKEGNDLHKTDALLLEKIEEMMLYIIEIKKENQELKLQIEELKKSTINK